MKKFIIYPILMCLFFAAGTLSNANEKKTPWLIKEDTHVRVSVLVPNKLIFNEPIILKIRIENIGKQKIHVHQRKYLPGIELDLHSISSSSKTIGDEIKLTQLGRFHVPFQLSDNQRVYSSLPIESGKYVEVSADIMRFFQLEEHSGAGLNLKTMLTYYFHDAENKGQKGTLEVEKIYQRSYRGKINNYVKQGNIKDLKK